jgi:hypothetical protein
MAIFHSNRIRDEHARLTNNGMTTDKGRCKSGHCRDQATQDVHIGGKAAMRRCAPHARIEIQLHDWGTR